MILFNNKEEINGRKNSYKESDYEDRDTSIVAFVIRVVEKSIWSWIILVGYNNKIRIWKGLEEKLNNYRR